jgi:hypothetical protein
MQKKTDQRPHKGDQPPGEFDVEQIILLWAFAEVALGGVLHAFRFPFTGISVGGASVLCLCLLGNSRDASGNILRALGLVLAIKAVVTPHAPAGAFLAVGFQGLAAALIFRHLPARAPACVLLGILALGPSAVQKVVFMTILYGMSLWEAVDVLSTLSLNFFGLEAGKTLPPSAWIIGLYLLLHLIFGFVIGMVGSRLPGWIRDGGGDPALQSVIQAGTDLPDPAKSAGGPSRRRRRILKRAAGVILTAGFIGLVVGLERQQGAGPLREALFLLVRVMTVALVYLFVISPLVHLLMAKLAKRQQETQRGRFTGILRQLPRLRPMAAASWHCTRDRGAFRPVLAVNLFLAAVLIRHPQKASANNNTESVQH